MKQKLQHIILLIILALAWTTQAWGIDWVNNWSSAPSLNTSFYLYNVDNNVFAKSGGSGSTAVTSAATATYWTYKNVQTGNWIKTDHYCLVSPDNKFIYFDHSSGDYDAKTNVTSASGNTEVKFNISGGKFQIRSQVSGIQQYFLFVSNSKLRVKYVAGSSNDYYQWYFINQIQYNNHLAIEAYETANNSVTSTYSSSNLPNTFYNQVTSNLNSTTGYLNYSSWLSSTDKSSSINSATSAINSWLSTAAAMKTAYANALTAIATAKTNSQNNNPANIAASDISAAETALEAATTTTAIANALANLKSFDAVNFDTNISATILAGNTVSNVASATSNRTLTYTSSNPSVISVSGTTLTAVAAGTATITATTGSTANGYYQCTNTRTFTVERNANTLTVIGNQTLKVDDTKTGVYSNKNNSTVSVQYEISNEVYTNESQNNGTGVISYDPATNTITAKNAGSATLRIYQTQNGVYEGVDKSLTVTVTKYDQTLNWTTADFTILPTEVLDVAESNSGLPVTYTTSDKDVISVTAVPGKVKGITDGTATITISQAGNYKYNAATSISHIFTVSKRQAAFEPAWGESLTTDIKVGTSTTIGLTNIATDATFTITNGDATVLDVSRDGNTLTITGLKAGTTTLRLNQAGSETLSGANTTYTIIVSRYANDFAVAAETKAMKVGDEWNGVVTNTGNNNTVVSYSPAGIATYDATYNKIVANAEGSTTITFTQAATTTHAAASKTIAVTVTKVTNTLSISLPTQAAEVGGTIDLSITGQNNTAAIVGEITETALSSSVNNGSNVITYDPATKKITACNAGTAKITFSQAATTKYTGYTSDTYEISVSKKANSITITNLGGGTATNIKLKYNATAALSYTSTNTDTSPVVTRASGSYTTYSNGTITAGSSAGTDIYEIRQDETYKYEAAYIQFVIRVNNTDEATSYVLYEEKEYSHGGGSGTIHQYTLSGPGETLTYSAKRQTAAVYYNLYVQYSVDGSNWVNAQDNTSVETSYKDFSCSIPETAKYVRFYLENGLGTLNKYIKNVKVTRKTYVRASSDETNWGTTYTDQTRTATFTVNHSSTNGGNISVSSNNPHFVPSTSSFSVVTNKTATDNSANNNTTYICGVDGTNTFTVTYTPDLDDLGEESADITIGDLFYSQTITLTATSQKYTTTIARGTNTATSTTIDGSIANAFAFSGTSTATPSADSDDDFYYTISHTQTSSVNNGTNVISYNPATNTVTGLNAGTARLTIYQKKTNLYHATSQSFDFTVTKLANNVGIALSDTELDVDGTATVTLTNNDSKGALSAAYSSVTYTNESQNRSGGLLSFADSTLTAVNAGTATVTITQAETYKYVAKSATFSVTVNKLTQTLTWDNNLETEMQVNTTLSGNTATSDVGLTPVTYSSNNTAAITVNATTGLLTAVAVGSNIAITASQAGNYKYLPATLTRIFSVFNKSVPVFTPDAHFTGTNGEVEQTCTATITITGVSTGNDFSITGYDDDVVNVVRSGETITITGLAIGSTTLTLTQTANEDYLGKTQTYNITVFWPDDFLALTPGTAPDYDEGVYRKIFLQRTLKAGYSTIAVPFDTDVATLTGRAANDEDWVAQLSAVTSSVADGYTLYFQKVTGGTIEANEPYVLHLGSQVVNPTWTNLESGISVEAAEATSIGASTGYSGYAGWNMWSNFTPNFAMAGKYGIVNSEGGFMLGSGQDAKLNAFAAYIAPPQTNGAPRLRVAYVDEDGTTTYVGSLPDEQEQGEPVAIYGPDGQRRSRMQRGLNIVRYADGTTKKVQY